MKKPILNKIINYVLCGHLICLCFIFFNSSSKKNKHKPLIVHTIASSNSSEPKKPPTTRTQPGSAPQSKPPPFTAPKAPPTTRSKPGSTPQSKPSTSTAPQAPPTTRSKPQPKSEPKKPPAAQPKSESKTTPKSEPKKAPATPSKTQPKSEPNKTPATQSKPQSKTQPQSETKTPSTTPPKTPSTTQPPTTSKKTAPLIDPKTALTLKQALMESIDTMEQAAPARITHKHSPLTAIPLQIDQVNREEHFDYTSTMIQYLHQLLQLPEFGEVKIELTLHQDGRIAKLVVLKTESEENKRYLESHLSEVRLPYFTGQLALKKEHTFTLTFCNDIN